MKNKAGGAGGGIYLTPPCTYSPIEDTGHTVTFADVAKNHNYSLEVNGSSGNIELEKAFAKHLMNMMVIFKAKQKSYGSGNISTFGEKGVFIRMWDKIQRLLRMVWHGIENPLKDENVEDTYVDLANYSIMALMCRLGEWK